MSALRVIEDLIKTEREKEEAQLKDLSNIIKLVKGLEQKFDERLSEIVSDSHYKMVCMEDIITLTSFSKSYIEGKILEGLFPKPKKFGRDRRWYKKDIEKWIRENMENDG